MALSLGPQELLRCAVGARGNDGKVRSRRSVLCLAVGARIRGWRARAHHGDRERPSCTRVSGEASLKRFQILIVMVLPLLIGTFDFICHFVLPSGFLPVWTASLVEMSLGTIGTFLFSSFVFGIIERITLENEQRRQEAEALFEVGTKITALLDGERVLKSVVEQARLLLGADVATIGLVEGETRQSVRLVAASGMALEQLEALRGQAGGDLPLEAAIRTGQACFQEHPTGSSDRIRCRLAVPLLLGQQVIGSLCIGDRDARHFSIDEVSLLTRLANQAAIAIENARLQSQAQRLATFEERDRIARELHDGLGQTLSYLALKMDVIEGHLESGKIELAKTDLARIRRATRDAAADVRESILGLKTRPSDGRDWLAALQSYLAQYGELNGIATELCANAEPGIALAPNDQVQLLRIVQEALTNVRKHANADQVRVRVASADTCLQVAVEDNGRGFDAIDLQKLTRAHFGLMIMRERSQQLGGELRVESRPGRGTRVLVELPYAAKEGSDGTATYFDS